MMRWLSGSTGMIVAAVVLMLPPVPARADSFFLGISSGDRHRHYRHHHHYKHRHYGHHHRHYHRPHYWSGYHNHYRPPVVIAPPVVYHAPPVAYGAPPIVSAVPSSPVYQAANGQYCREYQGTVTVNGVSQPSYGTACLMPDGAWRVVN